MKMKCSKAYSAQPPSLRLLWCEDLGRAAPAQKRRSQNEVLERAV